LVSGGTSNAAAELTSVALELRRAVSLTPGIAHHAGEVAALGAIQQSR
jgi:hypothetical protein